MTASLATVVELPVEDSVAPVLDLDVEQHDILRRRFDHAVATLVQESARPGPGGHLRHHEAERSLRIATNMRGHIR